MHLNCLELFKDDKNIVKFVIMLVKRETLQTEETGVGKRQKYPLQTNFQTDTA